MDATPRDSPPQAGTEQRRATVLDAALVTFARFGYRKTSVDDVAAEAGISRPGLYFLFESKPLLFRAAAERAIELDLATAERALSIHGAALLDRVVEAFDSWAGRYIGPLSDVPAVMESNPDLLGPLASAAASRFECLLVEALVATVPQPNAVAQTLISTSIGLKHQVSTRTEYLARFRTASGLILRTD